MRKTNNSLTNTHSPTETAPATTDGEATTKDAEATRKAAAAEAATEATTEADRTKGAAASSPIKREINMAAANSTNPWPEA